jgi:hypothetical protein
VALGDGVERAVAQADDAVLVVKGFVAALSQERRELGARGLGGDFAAESLGGGGQGAASGRRGWRPQASSGPAASPFPELYR